MLKNLFVLMLFWGELFSCTAFQLGSVGKDPIYCRSMEFAFPLDSHALVVPRGAEYVCTGFNQKASFAYKTKYGFVGMNCSFEKRLVSDGMNEKGLIVGALYLPGYTKYEKSSSKLKKNVLASWEFTNYLLGTCASIEEVKQRIQEIIVGDILLLDKFLPKGLKPFVLPLHFFVMESSGRSIVIEYVDGKRMIHENPIGVLTNSPPFDWQMANLSNYMYASPDNKTKRILKGQTIRFFGAGSGMQGVPGDYTPTSRFVRAALFSSFAKKTDSPLKAVNLGFHILNTFDIFDGAILSKDESDLTQWVIIHDPKNLKTFFRGYGSLAIQSIDLNRIDFSKKELLEAPLIQDFLFQDETEKLTPFRS